MRAVLLLSIGWLSVGCGTYQVKRNQALLVEPAFCGAELNSTYLMVPLKANAERQAKFEAAFEAHFDPESEFYDKNETALRPQFRLRPRFESSSPVHPLMAHWQKHEKLPPTGVQALAKGENVRWIVFPRFTTDFEERPGSVTLDIEDETVVQANLSIAVFDGRTGRRAFWGYAAWSGKLIDILLMSATERAERLQDEALLDELQQILALWPRTTTPKSGCPPSG